MARGDFGSASSIDALSALFDLRSLTDHQTSSSILQYHSNLFSISNRSVCSSGQFICVEAKMRAIVLQASSALYVLLSTSALANSLNVGRRAGAGVDYNYRICMANYWRESFGANAVKHGMNRAAVKANLDYIGGTEGFNSVYGPDCRKMAQAWNEGREMGLAERSGLTDDSGGSAAASFLLGVATGFVGGMAADAGGGGRRGTAYAPPARGRASQSYSGGARPAQTYRPPSAQGTVGRGVGTTVPAVVSQGGRSTSAPARSGQPVGYYTDPATGVTAPYYSKPPCATTRQTGATSYACTNY